MRFMKQHGVFLPKDFLPFLKDKSLTIKVFPKESIQDSEEEKRRKSIVEELMKLDDDEHRLMYMQAYCSKLFEGLNWAPCNPFSEVTT